MTDENDSRIVVYFRHEDVWRRAIVVASDSPEKSNVVASIYRRDARKVEKAIKLGKIKRR